MAHAYPSPLPQLSQDQGAVKYFSKLLLPQPSTMPSTFLSSRSLMGGVEHSPLHRELIKSYYFAGFSFVFINSQLKASCFSERPSNQALTYSLFFSSSAYCLLYYPFPRNFLRRSLEHLLGSKISSGSVNTLPQERHRKRLFSRVRTTILSFSFLSFLR